jgi:hypothetical protein
VAGAAPEFHRLPMWTSDVLSLVHDHSRVTAQPAHRCATYPSRFAM